jgi:hypothetical protein
MDQKEVRILFDAMVTYRSCLVDIADTMIDSAKHLKNHVKSTDEFIAICKETLEFMKKNNTAGPNQRELKEFSAIAKKWGTSPVWGAILKVEGETKTMKARFDTADKAMNKYCK